MAPTVAAGPRVTVRLRVVGMPTPDQLHGLTETIAASHDRGVALSLDLRELDPTLASSHAVRQLAAFLGELGSKGLRRIAVIAPAGPTPYGIARMLQLSVDSAGVETQCFQDDIVAEQWLLLASFADERGHTRTFMSPSGRQWTAEVYELPRGVGVRTPQATIPVKAVLRFSSRDLTLDLHSFPADWKDRTDDHLIGLLRQSSPPAFGPLMDRAVNELGVFGSHFARRPV